MKRRMLRPHLLAPHANPTAAEGIYDRTSFRANEQRDTRSFSLNRSLFTLVSYNPRLVTKSISPISPNNA